VRYVESHAHLRGERHNLGVRTAEPRRRGTESCSFFFVLSSFFLSLLLLFLLLSLPEPSTREVYIGERDVTDVPAPDLHSPWSFRTIYGALPQLTLRRTSASPLNQHGVRDG